MQPKTENTIIVTVGLSPAEASRFDRAGSWLLETQRVDPVRHIASGVLLVVLAKPTTAEIRDIQASFPSAPILAMVSGEVEMVAAANAGADFVLPLDAPRGAALAVTVAARRLWDERRAATELRGNTIASMRPDASDPAARVASAAHEINNPLQYIFAGIEELESLARSRSELRSIVEEMRQGAERIRRVTRSLLPSVRSSVVPLVTGAAEGTQPAPIERDSPNITRWRVLVVDDEEALVRTYRRCLRDHDVVTAVGGQAAIDILSVDHSFDVILCDLMMPNVDGPMVHAWVAEHHPALLPRILFCSGGAFTPRVRDFLDQSSNSVLEKPVTTAQLLKAIDKLVRRLSGT